MLQALVDALQGEGLWDSGGEISLDFVARSRKLAHLYRGDPAAPVLFIAQAAHQMNATDVNIYLERDGFQVVYFFNKPGLEIPPDPLGLCQPMRKALEACLAQNFASIQFELLTNDAVLRWQMLDGRVKLPPQRAFVGVWGRCRLVARRPAVPWWQLKFRAGSAAQMHHDLCRKLAFYTLSCRLDGRKLNYPNVEALVGYKGPWTLESLWLGPGFAFPTPTSRAAGRTVWDDKVLQGAGGSVRCRIFRDTPGPLKTLEGWELNNQVPVAAAAGRMLGFADGQTFANLNGPAGAAGNCKPISVRRWLGLPEKTGLKGALFYFKDGVLLNPLSLPELPVQCLVSDTQPDTDLSGWGVIRDDKVQADIEWALKEYRALVGA